MDLRAGNLTVDTQARKDPWFLGRFIDSDSSLHQEGFEAKWSPFPKGTRSADLKSNKTATTLVILIRGKAKIVFPEQDEEVLLGKEGDYVLWPPGVAHAHEILEDTLLLAIRWPSAPDDQVSHGPFR